MGQSKKVLVGSRDIGFSTMLFPKLGGLVCVIFSYFVPSAISFCWKPNINPFIGTPKTERLDEATVSVTWEDVFPKGRRCADVDFLIKSYPMKKPSDYTLSDLTLKGKRTATLNIPTGESYTFIVIAREDKGLEIGIEYAYSRPVASIVSERKEKSLWDSSRSRTAPKTTAAATTTTTTAPPPTTKKTYIRPNVKSLQIPRRLMSDVDYYEEYEEIEDDSKQSVGAAPWYVYECVPLLKNIAGFQTGSNKNDFDKIH